MHIRFGVGSWPGLDLSLKGRDPRRRTLCILGTGALDETEEHVRSAPGLGYSLMDMFSDISERIAAEPGNRS